MSVRYQLSIPNPSEHMVECALEIEVSSLNSSEFEAFMPVWSPGSYLVRDYSRHVRKFLVTTEKGVAVDVARMSKNRWKVEIPKSAQKIKIQYDVYCHELTVRTAHVDSSHAYLHGPCLFIGIKELLHAPHTVEIKMNPLWSKVATALKDISPKRETFLYEANNYDQLIDCPIELGCHESDGYMQDGVPHEICFKGSIFPHSNDLKKDMQTITQEVAKTMGELPFDRYLFMTHLGKGLYGGLEHANSTVLHFDGTSFNDRTEYVNWLALVAHEYFHAWNIKRIRPKELGPFDYDQENYTTMLWLAEGLTSFMDEVFVLRSGLCNSEEYLKMIANHLK